MLIYRILSVLVLIPLVVLAIFKLPMTYLAMLLVVIMSLAAWEWASLAGLSHKLLKISFVLVIIILICLIHFLAVKTVLMLGLISFGYLCIGIVRYQYGYMLWGLQNQWVRLLLGCILLPTCWLAMLVILMQFNIGRFMFMYCLIVVWLADSGAYFGGRLLGKSPLASRVSPKKTWEGLWSGIIVSLIFIISVSYVWSFSASMRYYFWAMSLIIVIVSVLGDLAISALKRISGVKDSGQLIPGHGGILDRIDSLIPTFLVVALVVLYTANIAKGL